MTPASRPACCDLLEDEIVERVSGELSPERAAEWDDHAAACAACAAALARERRLQALLRVSPGIPEVALEPPALPPVPAVPPGVVRFLWAATAAAAAFAVWTLVPLSRGGTAPGPEPEVGAVRITDVDDPSLAWDDGLLGLVAGPEAVASRRLVETR